MPTDRIAGQTPMISVNMAPSKTTTTIQQQSTTPHATCLISLSSRHGKKQPFRQRFTMAGSLTHGCDRSGHRDGFLGNKNGGQYKEQCPPYLQDKSLRRVLPIF
jgi:hypothetical protein